MSGNSGSRKLNSLAAAVIPPSPDLASSTMGGRNRSGDVGPGSSATATVSIVPPPPSINDHPALGYGARGGSSKRRSQVVRRLRHSKAEGISAQAARRFHRRAAVRKLFLHPHRSMAQLALALAAPLWGGASNSSRATVPQLSHHHRRCRLGRTIEAGKSANSGYAGSESWHTTIGSRRDASKFHGICT